MQARDLLLPVIWLLPPQLPRDNDFTCSLQSRYTCLSTPQHERTNVMRRSLAHSQPGQTSWYDVPLV